MLPLEMYFILGGAIVIAMALLLILRKIFHKF
jgi:hypothetical protein